MSGLTKLGKYLIRRELGKGAMGVVYEGFDPIIERTVAIKTILPTQLKVDEATDVLARFKREAQAAGRLNHPGIVAIYDYGEELVENEQTVVAGADGAASADPRVAYIAMEFVKGRELQDYFEANERFELSAVTRIMGEILAALGHAHAHGVVHRDIKPANLIVLDDGRVKDADFGIARVEKSELTQVGTVMGTPSYMSPEQFMGQIVDGRSDLFSCGVILYQFLTGERPFTGNTTTIMYKVLREEPLAPSTLNASLPGGFDAVVKKAMAKSADQRYQSAEEFATAIADVAANPRHEQPIVNDAGTGTSIAAPGAGGASTPIAAAAGSSRARSPKMVMVALAAVVVVILGAGLYFTTWRESGNTALLAKGSSAEAVTATRSAVTTARPAPVDAAPTAGNLVISALGRVDPKDPKFNGNTGAAQEEARADAKRQLVEKVLAFYVDESSLNKNHALIEQRFLAQPGTFIKTMLQEGTPVAGKDGLLETEARAVLKMRDVQKSLNQLSKDERIEFIRNNGDPKVAIQMTVANADTAQALPAARSQLAENVLKERIKSFGFRIWSGESAAATAPNARAADFIIQGEAKVKQLSAKLPASGLTITKTVLTSWTVKAIDKASGEEIYLNTVLPKGQSWASEDLALADIGKLMGEEFSKNFFLQYFNFGVHATGLKITGLPNAQTAHLLLRELRSMRQVLDAELINDAGSFQLQLAQGDTAALVQNAIIGPLNAKLGQNCFAFTAVGDAEVSVSFASACAAAAVVGKFESMPPSGLLEAPASRGKVLLKGVAKTTT